MAESNRPLNIMLSRREMLLVSAGGIVAACAATPLVAGGQSLPADDMAEPANDVFENDYPFFGGTVPDGY